jgi:hypothetical protein
MPGPPAAVCDDAADDRSLPQPGTAECAQQPPQPPGRQGVASPAALPPLVTSGPGAPAATCLVVRESAAKDLRVRAMTVSDRF